MACYLGFSSLEQGRGCGLVPGLVSCERKHVSESSLAAASGLGCSAFFDQSSTNIRLALQQELLALLLKQTPSYSSRDEATGRRWNTSENCLDAPGSHFAVLF